LEPTDLASVEDLDRVIADYASETRTQVTQLIGKSKGA